MDATASVSTGTRSPSRPQWQVQPPVAVDEYRTLMGSFPTGVAIVTAVDNEGAPHGMTCTSLSSVTLRPPTLLACLNRTSGTLAAVRLGGAFAINLLHARARRVAELFSSPEQNRFDGVVWRPSETVASPWLVADAFALAECRLSQVVEVGDHEVILGQVVNIQHLPDTPLLYGMRQYSYWSPAAPPTAPAGTVAAPIGSWTGPSVDSSEVAAAG